MQGHSVAPALRCTSGIGLPTLSWAAHTQQLIHTGIQRSGHLSTAKDNLEEPLEWLQSSGGVSREVMSLQSNLTSPSNPSHFLVILPSGHVKNQGHALHNHLAGCVSEYPSQESNLDTNI